MCGLAGLLTTRDGRRRDITEALVRMTAPIRHRGPDDDGTWQDADAGVGLGFRRLAILDLSPKGHQPMTSRSGRYVLVFNGEIYNHRALRRTLEGAGTAFDGRSDTEVILSAFEAWGIRAALPRFAGMFAMAVWDTRTRALTLIRDRLGKKPLFVFRSAGLVLFGSELKALAADPDFDRTVDPSQFSAYARYLYVPAPGCIYRNVMKLTPGHLLTITDAAAALPASEPWWEAEQVATAGRAGRITDEREGLDRLRALLEEATRERLESDVPLGALLSGGIDSALVVSLMQKLASSPVRTYTIGFDNDQFDETTLAARVAAHLGTDHTTMRVSGVEAMAVVPELPRIFDEPLADPSAIPTVLVCRLARRDVTVALCGDGGDDVFSGYNRYQLGRRMIARVSAIPAPLRRALGRVLLSRRAETWDRVADAVMRPLPERRRLRLVGERLQKIGLLCTAERPMEGYRSLRSAWLDPSRVVRGVGEAPDLLLEVLARHPELSLAERMMLADEVTYLPDDLLAKIDRASMAVGLEVRAPLLDHRVLEYAWSLPERMKVRGGVTKWVLREILAQHVPREMFDRPKMWFSMPVRGWLTGPLRPWAEELLTPGSLAQLPFLDARELNAEWQRVLAGRAGNGHAMWGMLQLIAWWREWRPSL